MLEKSLTLQHVLSASPKAGLLRERDTSITGPMVFNSFKADIESVLKRDPAARSRLEVVLCYPGLHAMFAYRISHALWKRDWRLLARFISHVAKIATGIEIHPGATIGERFFIDHGTGVVIGETAEVGNDVTLYQGVTLGGTSLEKGKRHPTLHDGVIVGSGAQVLGPLTLGEGARVGANAVVLNDVPKGVTVVGIPARMVMRENVDEEEFVAYGQPKADLPDPVARSIDSLRQQVSALMERIDELEDKDDSGEEASSGKVKKLAAGAGKKR